MTRFTQGINRNYENDFHLGLLNKHAYWKCGRCHLRPQASDLSSRKCVRKIEMMRDILFEIFPDGLLVFLTILLLTILVEKYIELTKQKNQTCFTFDAVVTFSDSHESFYIFIFFLLFKWHWYVTSLTLLKETLGQNKYRDILRSFWQNKKRKYKLVDGSKWWKIKEWVIVSFWRLESDFLCSYWDWE